MTKTSFLHVADIHLDSPLAGIKRLDAPTAARLQDATRRSLEATVAAALEHQVAAVVIAGDLFDGPVKDSTAGLWVSSQFKRLTREGIEVVLIRGNHDAVSNARRVTTWPAGVHELPADQPGTIVLDSAELAIHGQSFGARVESQDLAANYPEPKMGLFNIGLLHTSLSGSNAHDTYAPTSVETLESLGYDYWSLGHVHIRSPQSHSSQCYIGFSGNTQGRHIRETGAKGCQLVTIEDRKLTNVNFLPTDSLRWHLLEIDISETEMLNDLDDLIEQHAMMLLESADGRPLAVRVQLNGETDLHSELSRPGATEHLTTAFASRLSEVGEIWLESVRIATTPYIGQRSSEDVLLPIKYLSRITEEYRADDKLRDDLKSQLEELLKRARSELAATQWPLTMPAEEDAELIRLLGRAEDLVVARLMGERR